MNEKLNFPVRLKIISKANPKFWDEDTLKFADNILLNILKLTDKAVEYPKTDIKTLAIYKKFMLNYVTVALSFLGSDSTSISTLLPVYEEPYNYLKKLSNKEEEEKNKKEKEQLEKRREEFQDMVNELNVEPHKKANCESIEEIAQDSNNTTTLISEKSESAAINSPMAHGWICPKCGRVNAPWKSTCDCSKGIAVPNTPPNTPFPLAPNYEPYIPHTPYYNPPIETPNPYDPYGPYKWGDAPGWWNKGPTCETKPKDGKFVTGIEYPDGHIEKCPINYFSGLSNPIPCSPSAGDPNFGKYTTISTQTGGDPNIKAYNERHK